MSQSLDNSAALQQQVQQAIAAATPLNICGGNSKLFYGNTPYGTTLDVRSHQGIISYEPTELVITARSGTRLQEIESILADKNQMLAFEPPAFNPQSTIGGAMACNLSGPRRPCAGAARDFMLGCSIINGKAESLRFGGQVMKNVAGYDVSRLMAGALGTLGVILDVSLKVLPKPETELTLVLASTVEESIAHAQNWQRNPVPVSAISFDSEKLYVRISGMSKVVQQTQKTIGGETLADADNFWRSSSQQRNEFFNTADNLWRLSVPANSAAMELQGDWFYEWGGAQRWLKTTMPADVIRAAAQAVGGHATLYRGDATIEKFQPLARGLKVLHQQLKLAFDPHAIFNRGRLYRDI